MAHGKDEESLHTLVMGEGLEHLDLGVIFLGLVREGRLFWDAAARPPGFETGRRFPDQPGVLFE